MTGDIFKQFPIRLFGYGFAIGEPLRYRFSSNTRDMAESVAFLFITCHVLFSAYIAEWPLLIKVAAHNLCYELLASALIPRVVNVYFCEWVAEEMMAIERIPITLKRWSPVIAGFGTIPLFLLFLDPAVEALLDFPLDIDAR